MTSNDPSATNRLVNAALGMMEGATDLGALGCADNVTEALSWDSKLTVARSLLAIRLRSQGGSGRPAAFASPSSTVSARDLGTATAKTLRSVWDAVGAVSFQGSSNGGNARAWRS